MLFVSRTKREREREEVGQASPPFLHPVLRIPIPKKSIKRIRPGSSGRITFLLFCLQHLSSSSFSPWEAVHIFSGVSFDVEIWALSPPPFPPPPPPPPSLPPHLETFFSGLHDQGWEQEERGGKTLFLTSSQSQSLASEREGKKVVGRKILFPNPPPPFLPPPSSRQDEKRKLSPKAQKKMLQGEAKSFFLSLRWIFS